MKQARSLVGKGGERTGRLIHKSLQSPETGHWHDRQFHSWLVGTTYLCLVPRPVVWVEQGGQRVSGGHVPLADLVRTVLARKGAQQLQLVFWNAIRVDLGTGHERKGERPGYR